MVYCSKCGENNEEGSEFCVKCGASLYPGRQGEERDEGCFGSRDRRHGRECFGLPYGGAIAGIIIGVLILATGLGQLFDINVGRYMGSIGAIVIGIRIIAGTIYGITQRRRR
jgi:hypothetical protein